MHARVARAHPRPSKAAPIERATARPAVVRARSFRSFLEQLPNPRGSFSGDAHAPAIRRPVALETEPPATASATSTAVSSFPLEPSAPAVRPAASSSAPLSLQAQSVEGLHVVVDARTLRLKVGGRAGRASVEVEVREHDGELSLAIETEDGDLQRAGAWARAIDEALSRRGLRGQIATR
jgi:hypothetical protein